MTPFKLSLLARALAAGGDDSALEVVDEALDLTRQGELWSEAELIRIRGEVLLARDPSEAEACFQKALEISRDQGARSWSLRAAIDLAELWRDRGNLGQAREILGPVLDGFTEGYGTTDVKTARALLESMA